MKVELGKFKYKLLLSNGDVIENPHIEGLEVIFMGRQGGVVEIEEGAIFHNTKIYIGSQGYVHIKKTHLRGIRNTKIEMACSCKFKSLYIDSGCSIESSRFALVNDDDIIVKIGKNCMLSSTILFRACDGHTMFDVATGEVLNRTKPIVLGDHIWVGSEVVFLKGAEIPNNCIVGTRSIVTKRYTEEFTAITGSPASVVRRGINWDRATVPAYERELTICSTVA
ncbi:MAG: acyltransferase [Aeromonas veronii]